MPVIILVGTKQDLREGIAISSSSEHDEDHNDRVPVDEGKLMVHAGSEALKKHRI
jgi:hypothetical protein